MSAKQPFIVFWISYVIIYASGTGSSGLPDQHFSRESTLDLFATRGRALQLNCTLARALHLTPTGDDVTVRWLHDGVPVVADNRIELLPSGDLYIRKVVHRKSAGATKDGGVYQCRVGVRLGTLLGNKINVRIARVTRNIDKALNVTVAAASLVRLPCGVTSHPPSPVTWLKDGAPLPQNKSRFFILPSGVLHILSAQETDQGAYVCRASVEQNVGHAGRSRAPRSRLSLPINLFLHSGDLKLPHRSIIGPPKITSAKAGSDVTLECAPPAWSANTSWTLNDRSLALQQRHLLLSRHSLRIRDVSSRDAGAYRCHVVGGQSSAVGQLRVLQPPRLRSASPPNPIREPTAATVRLICEFDGFPTPHVSWYKNGQVVLPTDKAKVRGVMGDNLEIPLLSDEDAGYYQCFAENEAGSIQRQFLVIHETKASAPASPTNLQAVPVQGHTRHAIKVTWSTPNSELRILAYSVHYYRTSAPESEHQVVLDAKSTAFILDDLRPNTNYTVYIIAYNSESASSKSQKVVVKTNSKDSIVAPELRLQPESMTSLEADWDELEAATAAGYKISLRESGSLQEKTVALSSDVTSYMLSGLKPCTKYEVRVLLADVVPRSRQEHWKSESTFCSVDGKAGLEPNDVEAVALNSTAIRVAWHTEAGKDKEKIAGYRLSYQRVNDTEHYKILPVGEETKFEKFLSNLAPNTTYHIQVVAFSKNRHGEPVKKVVRTFSSGATSANPPRIKPRDAISASVKLVTSRAATVDWTVSRTLAPLKDFSVNFHPIDNTGMMRLVKAGMTSRSVRVDRLAPFTLYTVQVVAHGARGDVASAQLRVRTMEDLPSAPRDVKVTPSGVDAMSIQWSPPEARNGVVLYYRVKYGLRPADADPWTQKKLSGGELETQVSGLKADTVYYFSLLAATAAGEGPATEYIQVRTGGKNPAPRRGPFGGNKEHEMGVVFGVSIGGSCIIICIIIIILRNRCFPGWSRQQNCAGYHLSNGSPLRYPNQNGSAVVEYSTRQSAKNDVTSAAMLPHILPTDSPDSKGSESMTARRSLTNRSTRANGCRTGLCAKLACDGQVTSLATPEAAEEQSVVHIHIPTASALPPSARVHLQKGGLIYLALSLDGCTSQDPLAIGQTTPTNQQLPISSGSHDDEGGENESRTPLLAGEMTSPGEEERRGDGTDSVTSSLTSSVTEVEDQGSITESLTSSSTQQRNCTSRNGPQGGDGCHDNEAGSVNSSCPNCGSHGSGSSPCDSSSELSVLSSCEDAATARTAVAQQPPVLAAVARGSCAVAYGKEDQLLPTSPQISV